MAPTGAMTFGALLKRARLAAGLTQEGLAERAGLSAKAVSDLERGPARTPQLDTVARLAGALALDREGRAGLLAAARPPAAPPARPRLTLPRPLTPLIGRARETDAVVALVQRPGVRLVTLTGPGGVGKTRLAVAAGERLAADFADGVVFVDLAPLRDAGLVLSAVARALDLSGVASGTGPPAPPELLQDRLRERRLLLLLDNVEQVIATGPTLLGVLAACARLKALLTSREPLRVRGEHVYQVAPLALPPDARSPRAAARSPAVELFLERASAAGAELAPDTATAAAVAELCRRLDGLPLALELAAARVRLFPPQALLRRLTGHDPTGHDPTGHDPGGRKGTSLQLLSGGARDAPGRHQTLRGAIEWSYRLLSAGDRRRFAQLSVFAGGWTLEAAAAVRAGRHELEVLEGLASLVDKSLVQPAGTTEGEPRFRMLETIREYAVERLEAAGRAAPVARRRHAAYYLAIAREAEAAYWGPDQALWLRRLNRELDNLRAALAWGTGSGEVELTLQLGGALQWFWHDSGHWREGRARLEAALAAAAPAHRTPARAAALNAAGLCNWCLGDFAAARAQTEASLALCRELRDVRGMGRALHGLGVLAAEHGDLAGARLRIEEGLALSRAAGDRPFVGLALHNLGSFAVRERDEPTARSRIEESRRVWEELGSRGRLALAALSLGELARSGGAYAEAAAHYRESLELAGGPPTHAATPRRRAWGGSPGWRRRRSRVGRSGCSAPPRPPSPARARP